MIQLGDAELKFAKIIWECEPISSSALARAALESLSWKKTTAYTVLRRLCDKGLFKNEGGTVSSLITYKEFNSMRIRSFIEENFAGSLPAFLAAFTAEQKLTPEEIAELKRIVDSVKSD